MGLFAFLDRLTQMCSISDCSGKVTSRGWCAKHYKRWQVHGDPNVVLIGGNPVITGPRECTYCGIIKDENEFYLRKDRNNGSRSSRCKTCSVHIASNYNKDNRDKINEWVRNNKDKIYQTQQKYRASENWKKTLQELEKRRDPVIRRDKGARRRARIKGVRHEKVDSRVVLANHGPYCGICLRMFWPGDKIEMDHIIPIAKGGSHTYKNIQPAHERCNKRKSDKICLIQYRF